MVSNLDIGIISWWYLLWISIKSSMVILTLACHLFDLHEFRQRAYQGKFRNLNSVIQRKKKSRWKSITTSPRHHITSCFPTPDQKDRSLHVAVTQIFAREWIHQAALWCGWQMRASAVSIVIFLLPKDAGKVDVQSILSCQNGGAYGPKSIKSKDLK